MIRAVSELLMGESMSQSTAVRTRRKPSFRISSLDGLRALAIMLVFAGHSEQLPKVIEPGVGVTIFFFLSGYLITTLLRREYDIHGRISLKDFYLRRVWRIFPPLYVTLLAGLAITLAGVLPGDVSAGGTASSFVHFANYWVVYFDEGIPKALRVLWSLAVEEHFYLLFPLAYVLMRKRQMPARKQAIIFGVLCLIVLAWRSLVWFAFDVDFDHIYYSTDTRLDSILWGCVFAIVANPVMDKPWGPDWFWKWVAVPAGAVLTVIGTKGFDLAPTIGYTMQAFGMALAFTSVIRFPRFFLFAWLNWKPMVWLGVVSYSFYLVHRFFILWVDGNLSINPWAQAAVSMAGALVAAWAMHVWVEKPAGRMRQRLSHAGEASDDSLLKARHLTRAS